MPQPSGPTVVCPSCSTHGNGKFCHECGAPLTAQHCASCNTEAPVGARFCSTCGASLIGASAPNAGTPPPQQAAAGAATKYLPWGVAALVAVIAAGYVADRQPAVQGGDTSAPLSTSGGAAPDISAMSPRERAARLYDRMMRYAEEGKADSIKVFAPMAMGAFDLLGPDLDVDARYDYGRVASEADEFAVAAAQADTILKGSPTHLLGLALAARVADRQGRVDDAEKHWRTFLSARDAELKKDLPEYQAHAGDIEAAVRLATASVR